MGLFNFGKKKDEENKQIIILAPINGKVLELKDVPDVAFAEKMIGDGCAIDPTVGNKIYSPIDGSIESIFTTNHAISFETNSGLEMIVHFGIDTVTLNGKYLKRLREEGKVKIGDEIMEYDLEGIKSETPSAITPIVIANMEKVKSIEILSLGKEVKVGDPIMKVIMNN